MVWLRPSLYVVLTSFIVYIVVSSSGGKLSAPRSNPLKLTLFSVVSRNFNYSIVR